MDQDLRDLVEQMRQLIPVLQGMSGTGATSPNKTTDSGDRVVRSVDRMVVALGQLAVRLDTTKKTRAAEEEAVKKFTKAVENTADKLDEEEKQRQAAIKKLEEETKAREEAIRRSKLTQKEREEEDKQERLRNAKEAVALRGKAAKEQADDLKRTTSSSAAMFDSLSTVGSGADLLKTKFFNLGGDSLAAQAGLQLFSAGLTGTGKSLKTFSTGLLNGERGAQLSAKALTNFATPLLDVADKISTVLGILSFIPGPIGGISRVARAAGSALIGLGAAAGKAAVQINEIDAKRVDALFKSYNDLNSAGISLTGGIEGAMDLMHRLNLTTTDAAKFQELLAKNNKQLALMGGTAASGAQQFAKVAGSLVKSNLGETFERMGITQDEQREAALLYMSIQARTGQLQLKNVSELVNESGKFVEELDRAAQLTGATRREQQEAREAAMAEVRFRAALIDAERRGDKADQEQLQIALRTSAILKSLGDEKAATGVLQQAAGRGALTTGEAIAAEMTYKLSEILNNPNITDEQILEQLAKSADANLASFAATNRLVGGIDNLQTDIRSMDNSVRRQRLLAEEAAAAGFTGPKAITEFLKKQEEDRKKSSKSTEAMTAAGRAQQNAAMIQEKALDKFGVAAKLNETASKAFAKAVEQFGNILGVNSPAGGLAAVSGGGLTINPPAGFSGGSPSVAREARIGAESNLSSATATRVAVEKEKGRGSPEAKAARIAEFKARRQAEIATATEQSAGIRAAREAGITGSSQRQVTEKPISKVISSEPGSITVETADGDKQQRIGNANWRMNNPGNLRPTQWTMSQPGFVGVGDAGPSGQFAVFATKEYGLKAKENLLFGGQTPYATLSLRDAMYRYAPETDRNDTEAYIRSIVSAVGVPDTTMLSNFSPMQRSSMLAAIEKFEGFAQGKVVQAANGGMFNGPMSGYPAVLHGNEAVIPLKNGMVPVSMPSLDELVASNRNVDAQVQVLRNELGSMMRELTTALVDMRETGHQSRMIELLESISRNQQTTATASQRIAQLAAN